MPYTQEQVDTLVILNVIASTFSFLGATFIIANFFAFDDFRSNFAFKLILFVAIGDVINSVGNFCGSPDDNTALCHIQAFLTQFGDIVSFAWVTAVAWVIYNVIRREVPPTREDVEKWYRRIHMVIWPSTIILSILPWFTDNYGLDNGLCWITFYPNPAGEVWRWICFYIPLWGSIIYVGVVYYKIWGQLTAKEIQRRNSGAIEPQTVASNTGKTDNVDERQPEVRPSASDVFNDGTGHHPGNSSAGDVIGGYQPSTTDVTNAHQPSAEDNQPPKSGGGTLQRIKFYPFVLFGCYAFATIRRVAEWASDDHVAPFAVAAIQVFTSALLGTCNAILYGFTPVVRKKDSEWFRSKCCGGGDGAGGNSNDDPEVR
eukprot:CAMPEP_0201573238 /NCGR_PEP_ID=MMETSP0190_2-20130828/16975_1 /ASSEMBLY_ACC=CAM_ASM_000263 /TAXON_ID=37353 /ORGANISM="Rosalina sp." /LENGTH=371 /DNA_ID=CAMNT_0047999961 /DNA_START=82 /DNA_END=1197 /DNA_ORIENTATION=-